MSNIKKECPKCGRVFPFDNMFCSIDGTKLKEVSTYKYFNVMYNTETGAIEHITTISEPYRDFRPNVIDIEKIDDLDEFLDELKTFKIVQSGLYVCYDDMLGLLIQIRPASSNFYILNIERIEEAKLMKIIGALSEVSNFSFEYLKKSVRLSSNIIEKYKKLPDSLKLKIEVE